MAGPVLDQLNLIVRDMDASLSFYRALGLDIPDASVWRTSSGAHHVEVEQTNGFELAFDSPALARVYDRGWPEGAAPGPTSVLTFRVETRDEVDRLHSKLTGLGHRSLQPPYDTFWGSRYAIVKGGVEGNGGREEGGPEE
ncbi:MAG: VOC family protein [Myxococcota bacterium]